MGNTGIDNWCLKMEEHKRKGHRIIKYEQDILLREKRVTFWENHHSIPTVNDLIMHEVET